MAAFDHSGEKGTPNTTRPGKQIPSHGGGRHCQQKRKVFSIRHFYDSQTYFKVARCVGDHMDISNSAGSSHSAEESFILLDQMVLTRCVPCTLNMPI